MKAHIYKLMPLLAVFMPTVTLRSEEITAISDPFVFGAPAPVIPLSSLPLVVVFMLIGVLVILHYYRTKKQAL